MRSGNWEEDMNRSKIVYLNEDQKPVPADQVKLLYCLRGGMDVVVGGKSLRLGMKDLVVVNYRENYGWTLMPETVVMMVQIHDLELVRMLGRKADIKLSSTEHRSRDYGQIRFLLDSIVKHSVGEKKEFKISSLYYMLWDYICEQFIAEETPEKKEHAKRIQEILRDIEENYAQDISLSALAGKYHMSDSSFSRYFQKNTGEKFVDYLRRVRMTHAREFLLTTDRTVTEVAYDCGFSNLSVFNRNFRAFYKKTPLEMRAMERAEQTKAFGSSELSARTLEAVVALSDNEPRHSSCPIFIDAGNESRPGIRTKVDMINIGQAEDLLDVRICEQMDEAVKELKIRYVRIANIFSSSLRIRREHDGRRLNFERLDLILDHLEQRHLIPVIELPEKERRVLINISYPGTRADDNSIENEQVFTSLDEWEEVLDGFLVHIIDRYLVETVKQWVFEFRYDAFRTTGAGKLQFLEVYKTGYRVLRERLPEAQILASGICCSISREILRKHLVFFREKDLLPDGLSLIIYPYHLEQREGAGNELSVVSDTAFVENELNQYTEVLEELSYPDLPLWITEWNTSLSNRNAYNDTTAKACHMLTQIRDAYGRVAHMGYWNLSDWSAQYIDTDKPFMGGVGIISKDGIRKPSYFALQFSCLLGESILKKGQGYLITERIGHNYCALLFNPRRFGFAYQQRQEGDFKAEDLSYVFQDNHSVSYHLNFSNLVPGDYQIISYRMYSDRGNPLSEWKKLNYRGTLRSYEVSYLKSICIPRMEYANEKTADGSLQLKVTLGPNDFSMILLAVR